MSTERIVVDLAIARPFAEALAARAAALPVGDPSDPGTAIGALVDAAARSRVEELIADAVARGAEVLCGGEPTAPASRRRCSTA